ncbi:MAG: hypothetical protein JXX14_11090 [Deltaproteobacteria bacterium]|nr:hypothetical protein [Deltaproteobacteria bacterium]
MNMKKYGWILIGLILFAFAGCDDSDSETASAPLTLELWGEEFIEKGIPAEVFADGYALTYQKFLISLSNVKTAETEGDAVAARFPEQKIWDLTPAGPFVVGQAEVPTGAYENTGYAILQATAQATSGNATPADVQMMIQNKYSVYVEGTAKLGDESWTFAWGFQTNTVYGPCHSTGTVTEAAGGAIEITIHGDHFFYDSAVSTDPALRFADIALADADGDYVITQDELAQYSLAPLAHYMVPPTSDAKDMWGFLSHMTATLGHIDGEGHCETE